MHILPDSSSTCTGIHSGQSIIFYQYEKLLYVPQLSPLLRPPCPRRLPHAGRQISGPLCRQGQGSVQAAVLLRPLFRGGIQQDRGVAR